MVLTLDVLVQVVLPIEASLSPHDPLAKWEDHEACWQMQYRGSLGKPAKFEPNAILGTAR